MNNSECIRRYLSPFTSGKDLIIVTNLTTNELSHNDSTSLLYAFQTPIKGNDWDTESTWLCADNSTWPNCSYENAPTMALNWTIGSRDYTMENPDVWSAPVKYCLSGGTPVENTNYGFH